MADAMSQAMYEPLRLSQPGKARRITRDAVGSDDRDVVIFFRVGGGGRRGKVVSQRAMSEGVRMIRCVVTDPSAVGAVKLSERELRHARPNEAIVEVTHFSLNRGEVSFAAGKPANTPIGWDVAGTVATPAADGGPDAGTRVAAFSRVSEGWAQRVVVPLDDLAPVPDGVPSEVAATLPVAALTALACLDHGRKLLGSKVLVTGATGGVGMFGVQLAKLSGAFVTAQVRRREQIDMATRLGADEVVVTGDGAELNGKGPFRLTMDAIGGSMLAHAVAALEPEGEAITYGLSGKPTVELQIGALLGKGLAKVRGLNLYAESGVEPISKKLVRILRLVEAGRVQTEVGRTGSWTEVGEVARDLIDRSFSGKAVLAVD